VDDSLPIEHLQLQLQLPAEKQRELSALIQDLQNPASPKYRKWLTPDRFREEFRLAPEDMDAAKTWLESQGFTINVIYPSSIDFSGTAGQVIHAFHTEIHNYTVAGTNHFANISDPMIPAALAPAVVGVVALNDFTPQPLSHPRTNYTVGGGTYLVVPADLATIYNFNPLFAKGISGQGQTIVVVEDSDVYSTADWNTFRSTFGLSQYSAGSFTQIHPAPQNGPNNCSDPGVNGDDGEAILDAEWATAGAPNAAIVLASCANTSNFGGFIALQNLLNQSANPPSIISVSYGESESQLGAAMNAYINALYMQAVTEGVSIFVSAGDEGAASTDVNVTSALHGIAVSGFASTPYNVAVGGTDFGDTFTGSNNIYWNSSNTAIYGSAKSYVPEIPWNDSCASGLIATYLGFTNTYGSGGFCNSSTGTSSFLTTVAGSGGPSGCAAGSPSISGIVGGSCTGYAKPGWQLLLGNPSDGVRDIPDVSLFAANGVWGHYYVVCYSDTGTNRRGSPCTGTPNTWVGFGGTSVASPIMAAMQSLVNQATGTSAGNPNPIYYSLANAEYGATGDSACNSSLGEAAAGTCIFYDVTQGDIDVNCRGTHNCYLPSGSYGVLSTSNSQYQPAFGAGNGWDFATGIGTVNVNNLVNNWPKPPSITSGPIATFVVGTQGTFSVTTAGTPAPTIIESGNLPNGITFNSTTSTLGGTAATGTGGTYNIIFTASNGVGANAVQNFTLTVDQAPAITSSGSTTFAVGSQGIFTVTATGFPAPGLSESGNLPSGITFNPSTGTLSGSVAIGTGGTYNVSFTASNGVGANAIQSFTLIVNSQSGTTGAAAAFLYPDSMTQGSWSRQYGADGYSLANANQALPTYDSSFAVQGQQSWTWASGTTDPRALQIPGGSAGIAATWYNISTFRFDVNITTGTHEVAIYAVDWDDQARSETIQISDATSGAILDSRSISNFTNGMYLVWNISGHVTVRVSCSGGPNAVISGIFFGSGASVSSSPILSVTKTHSGNFVQGQQNANYSVAVSNAPNASATNGPVTVSETIPSGLSLVSMTGTGWACGANSCIRSDALNAGSSYPPITVTVNVAANASSPQVNQVSVSGGGSANASASDSATITESGATGASAAAFVAQDANTAGNWLGLYGGDGYSLANANQALPSYDPSFTVQGQQNWTWASSTSDPRALQIPGGSGGIAATWYNNANFSFDLNVGSGAHQVAIYAVDWDTQGRSETIQISDASSGALLDSRSISNFSGGIYLLWNISGHVTMKISCNGGANAVVSGVFFGSGARISSSPILSVAKTHSGNFVQGQQNGIYTVTVSNAMNGATTSGPVTVNEAVPSGLQLVSMAGTGWTCEASSCTRSDALGAGSSYPPITVSVVVALNATSPQVNEVTVSGGGSATASASDSTVITGGGSGGNAATFTGTDAITKGSWQGLYGLSGYALANANQLLPSFDPSFAVQSQQNWTWVGSTTDPRALQLPGGTEGIAATWYSTSAFSFDVNVGSGTNRVALYAVDWDLQGRSETIQILDASTGATLDTRSISNFTNGLYLIWNISGHVTIRVSANNPPNAVVGGVFFN
jgi:uncharacterized repeat protein (TIGR01451 family)